MLKAVIFDMDGVIIDSEPAHIRLENEIFKELGIEVPEEEHCSFVGTTSYYMWDCLINKHKLEKTVEELVEYDRDRYFKYLNSHQCEVILIEGVKEFIKELYDNGLRLAIASSSPLNVIEAVAKKFELEKFFKAFVTGDYVERSKPEPDIFLYAAEKLAVDPSECIVIEDSHNGVMAAMNAGMKCVGINSDALGRQDISMADIVINKFSEINCSRLSI